MSLYSRMHACKSSWYSSTTFQEHVAHAVVALLHDLLARLVRRRFVVAVAAVAVVHGAPAVNVVGAAAAAASCALCPFRSSSWSLPHGRRCRFIVVRARLHESSRRSRRPLSKGMVGAVHRECAPGGAPPRLTPMESLFSPVSPKSKKGHFGTFWEHFRSIYQVRAVSH